MNKKTCKFINLFFLLFTLIFNLFFFSYTKLTDLNLISNFEYNFNKISDVLILNFKENPICLSEPKRINIKDSQDYIDYYLPLASISFRTQDKILKILNKIKNKNSDFIIDLELVKKPIIGIKINIKFNKDKINFELIRRSNSLRFEFHNKLELKYLIYKDSQNISCA